MSYTAIIIDDEARARRSLTKICDKYITDLEVVAEAEEVPAGLHAIRTHQPDLLFLDIEMPLYDGFALLEDHVLPDLDVIFTTAHAQYAIRALRVQAQDYLLKPISISDLEAAMERFRERRQAGEGVGRDVPTALRNPSGQAETVALPSEQGLLMSSLADVIFCEGVNAYTVFHLSGGRQIIVTRTLKQIAKSYAPRGFYRVHHRYLINLHHLRSVNAKDNLLEMKNGAEVPISHRKKAGFLKLLKGWN